MKSWQTFIQGFGFKNIRIAGYCWLFNFFFSLLLFFGINQAFLNFAGESVLARDVTAGNYFLLLSDFLTHSSSSFLLMLAMGVFFFFLFILFSFFISSGVYTVFSTGENPSFLNLLAASWENFFGFIKVFLVNLVNWAVALAFSGLVLMVAVVIQSGLDSDAWLEVWAWSWIVLTVLCLVFASAIADFSKIWRVKEGRNSFYCFWKGLRFVFSHARLILALVLFYLAANAVLLLLVWALFGSLERIAQTPFWVLLIAYELAVFLRYFLKVSLVRSQVNLAG